MHTPSSLASDRFDAPVAVTAHYELPVGGHFDRVTYEADHLPLARRVLAPHGLLALWALHPDPSPRTERGAAAGPITAAITVAVFTDRGQARAALAACGAELAAHARRYASHPPRVRLCALSGWPTAFRP